MAPRYCCCCCCCCCSVWFNVRLLLSSVLESVRALVCRISSRHIIEREQANTGTRGWSVGGSVFPEPAIP
uniref:Putative secreted protein n=1 Tax=Anopheles darlingi TaxID=43151 RepID=A0A2M4DE15_ANODA